MIRQKLLREAEGDYLQGRKGMMLLKSKQNAKFFGFLDENRRIFVI